MHPSLANTSTALDQAAHLVHSGLRNLQMHVLKSSM